MNARTKRGRARPVKPTREREQAGPVSAWPKATEEFSPQEIAFGESLASGGAGDRSLAAGAQMLRLSQTVRRLVREVYRLRLDVAGDPGRTARLQDVLERALARLEDLGDDGIVTDVATDEDTETIVIDPEP